LVAVKEQKLQLGFAGNQERSKVMNTHIEIARAPVSAVRGVALIVLGIIAVAFPIVASITTSYFVAWVLIVAGCTHLLVAWRTEKDSMLRAGFVSFVYVLAGIVIFANPLLGIASITLLLGITLMVEGVLSVIAYFTGEQVSGWVLFSGCITIVLAIVIASGWLSTSLWMVGTLVGINLVMRGVFDLAAWMERERLSHLRA